MISIGIEFASFLPNEFSDNEVQLKTVIIPVVTKTISFNEDLIGKNQTVKKLPFSTKYKLKIYENNDGIPGRELLFENITFLLNEKSNNFEIDVEEYDIYIPKEGLYIGLLNLGQADENGKLIPASPYTEKMTENGIVKIANPVKPYFPINTVKDSKSTFFRQLFDNDTNWKLFSKGNMNKNKPHNISFGYRIKIYK